MIVLMLGAPGVGKGTQADLLQKEKNIPHLSTGAMLRNAIEIQSPTGLIAAEYVNAGRLVPDSVVTTLVKESLESEAFANGCILDGYPRNSSQATELDLILQKLSKKIDVVVNIFVPEETIVARMLERGRKDDTEDVIRHRLVVYRNETAPLLDYYGLQGKVVTIDGNNSVEAVFKKIQEVLNA